MSDPRRRPYAESARGARLGGPIPSPLPSGTPSPSPSATPPRAGPLPQHAFPSPSATPLRRGRYPTSGPGTRPRLLSDAPEPGGCPPASGPGSPSATPPRPGLLRQALQRLPRAGTPPRPRYLLGSGPSVSQRCTSGRDAPLPLLKTLHPLPKPLSDTPLPGQDPLCMPHDYAPCAPATYPGGPQRLPAQERVPSPSAGSRMRSLARHCSFFLARSGVDFLALQEACSSPETTRRSTRAGTPLPTPRGRFELPADSGATPAWREEEKKG